MTFAVNYVGEPFNTPLLENKFFAASVKWSAGLYVTLVLNIPVGAWAGQRVGGCVRDRVVSMGGLMQRF